MAKTTTKATPTPESRNLEPHELVMSPTIQAAVGIQAWGKFMGEVDLAALLKDLRERLEKVQDGDMRPAEAMLYGQAMTLQTIFTSLARRAASNDGLKQFQVNMTLALKAQAQSRATLEALAEIKNPRPVAFVKQANISNGPQQVNNGAAPVSTPVSTENRTLRPGAHAHAGEIASQRNELLEQQHGNYLDARTPSTAGRTDQELEAVATGHRTTYR